MDYIKIYLKTKQRRVWKARWAWETLTDTLNSEKFILKDLLLVTG